MKKVMVSVGVVAVLVMKRRMNFYYDKLMATIYLRRSNEFEAKE